MAAAGFEVRAALAAMPRSVFAEDRPPFVRLSPAELVYWTLYSTVFSSLSLTYASTLYFPFGQSSG